MEKVIQEEKRRGPSTGLVLGKFLPPHQGHRYLIDFARNWVDHVTVVVGTLAAEPIPGELRFQWMREMFPDLNVLHLTDENPSYPEEHPDFWDIWRDSLLRLVPDGVDYLFASEDYGYKLAEVIGATYVPVDHGRELVPVSGSQIRQSPMRYWKYLPDCVRPYFVKRVCICGAESVGKSVLTKNLAAHFDTVYATEYARPLLALQNDEVYPQDIPRIARGHIASENALECQANRVLICDTDVITTTIWSDILFGGCPEWILEEADRRHYDLHIMLDTDVPFVDDPQRFLKDEREALKQRFIDELEKRNRRYVIVGGDWQQRFDQSVALIEELLRD